MDDILNGYSQEEIEALAIERLEINDFEETPTLKIIRIDKEYKEHNKQAIKKAIINGAIILLCAGLILSSDSNISDFRTEDLTNIFDNIIQSASSLPKSDILVAVYIKMFDGINYIIDKIGLIGIYLAIKSIKFILSSVKDTSKTIKMRKELADLKQVFEEKEKKSGHTK